MRRASLFRVQQPRAGSRKSGTSDVATEMFSRLEVKEAPGPPPSVGAEPPAYRATLRGGVVVAGYLVKRKTP